MHPRSWKIIRIVEQSRLPARRTLEQLGIPRATFHRWYDRFLTDGVEALEDRPPRPGRVWNRIPEDVRDRIVELALNKPELSPRELAVTFTDTESYFVSEASVYRLLKAHDLITNPAFIVIKAADEFKDKTTAPNQLWQTDFSIDERIGIVSLVGDTGLRIGVFQQRLCAGEIMRLSWRQHQAMRIAQRVDERVDLGGQPAAGSADGLLAVFFRAPALC